ncbi:MAG: beta-glucosidase BglX [Prevotella sp.]|nr:beta-glucosidase BglX [Prevotella sp.]
MKKTILILAMALLTLTASAQKKSKTPTIKPMRAFVDDLMSRMTLQEKIGQLNLQVAGDIVTGGEVNTDVASKIRGGQMGGVFNLKGATRIRQFQQMAVEESRLGIPLLIGMDVIHGYETIFPIPLAMSCSWDIDAVETSARIAAKEASADGINWTFSPMVDICVDARWGRTMEGNGEDPWLSGQMGAAMVRGYQGTASSGFVPDIQNNQSIMACLKHYALYGAAEAGRDYNTVDMSRLRMQNQYLPPYKAAVKAGVGSVMSSFNIVDGVPATANRWLLNDLLRRDWRFDGFVVTDYASITEMLQHGVGENLAGASALALTAGTDMDMCAEGFLKTLEQSYQSGRITLADIDQACRRVLEAKYRLGLFHDPYKYCDAKRRARDIFTQENRDEARRIAAETFVLLKNKGNVLPLKPQGKIALIGPLANTRANLAGSWCVAYTPDKYSTVKEAFERRLAGTSCQLLYAQGSNVCADAAEQEAGAFGKTIPRGDDEQLKQEALQIARQADVIVCAMGESAEMSGESSSRSKLEIPDVQQALLKELVKLGKPVVLLNFSGRATVLSWENEHVDAIMNVWFGGSETGDAICDVLFGDKSPCGKLTVTMPQSVGQVPIYYNHLNTGRPVPEDADHYFKYQSNYLDVRNDPLFPFGYGLSYTTFAYTDVRLSASEMGLNGSVNATVTVTNTGGRDADEVVQLYIRDPQCSVSRPVKELKGFRRIHLKAGESQQVSFTITREQLAYLDAEGRELMEPGLFHIMVGPDSKRVSQADLTVR